MKAYQADIAKLEAAGSTVLGISVDSLEANAKFAQETGVTFPLLSDTTRQVSQAYGVLDPLFKWATRSTFVVNPAGVIQHVQYGGEAIDPSGTVAVCMRSRPPA